MVELTEIPIRDLPQELKKAIHENIRWFSITIVVDRSGQNSYTCAGTLCSISGIRGITTARHVWEQLQKESEVLVLAGNAHRVSIDPRLLRPVVPPAAHRFPDADAEVPDIAFLQVPDHDCRTLEAYGKAFYSIDRRRSNPDVPLYEEHGYWAVCGAPQALLDPDHGLAANLVYGTNVSKSIEVGTRDYLEIDLDLDANPDLPADFQGASGGGLWRAPFCINEAEAKFQVILVGVNFWQTELPERRLVAHGPCSIYQRLHEQVSAAYGT